MPTTEELKAAIRAFIYDKDMFTSNGAANIVHAFDTIIDGLESAGSGGGGETPGIDDVLAVGQAITGNRNTLLSPNAKWIIADDLSEWLRLDNTENQQQGKFIVPNNDNTGYSEMIMYANDDDGYRFKLETTNGLIDAYIIGRGDENNKFLELSVYDGVSEYGTIKIEPNKITQTGDVIISGLAGGGTTGLSIDNDGKVFRTP